MIYVVATTKVRPEHREAYIAGARTCIAATRQENGCVAYDLHTSVTEPDKLVFVERWESKEALAAHSSAPHVKVWRELSAPFKAEPTVIEIISDARVQVR